MLGGPKLTHKEMESWERDVTFPPNSKPRWRWRPWLATRRWPSWPPGMRVHPNMIAQWKRQAKESLAEVFAKKTVRGAADRDAEVTGLHAKIGQLTVENDFLSKAFGR